MTRREYELRYERPYYEDYPDGPLPYLCPACDTYAHAGGEACRPVKRRRMNADDAVMYGSPGEVDAWMEE